MVSFRLRGSGAVRKPEPCVLELGDADASAAVVTTVTAWVDKAGVLQDARRLRLRAAAPRPRGHRAGDRVDADHDARSPARSASEGRRVPEPRHDGRVVGRLVVVTGGGKGIGRAVGAVRDQTDVVTIGRTPGKGLDEVLDIAEEEQVVAL